MGEDCDRCQFEWRVRGQSKVRWRMNDEFSRRNLHGYEASKKSISEVEGKFDNGKIVISPALLSMLRSDHLNVAIYEYFFRGDELSLKSNLYSASELTKSILKIEGRDAFSTDIEIFCALMSDCDPIVADICNFDDGDFSKNKNNPLLHQFVSHMYQLAIKSSWDELQFKIDKISKNGKKYWRNKVMNGGDFFSLLIAGDVRGLEKSILEKVSEKPLRPVVDGVLSVTATLEAKICWRHGIAVEFDNPLIPMDLLPIRPLPEYKNAYDFMFQKNRNEGGVAKILKMIGIHR
ncbi:Imm49 family immunity protein [Pandoraea sputorum]|uniref:Imm49 family immunity protein n=2 Tax=Pandoraea sputorum TaxID=93222 RepID=UPI002F3FC9C3